MAVSFVRGGSSYGQGMASGYYQGVQRPLAGSLPGRESLCVAEAPSNLVIVMDGLKEFNTELLRWALENIPASGCTSVTLIGAMPWLNIPLSSKTSRDVWAVELEELFMAKLKNDQWKSDAKYVKLQAVLDLCQQFGVVLQKDVAMGYPLKLKVLEKITRFQATWVVFDRYQMKKDVDFISEKIPCNMVMMSENGDPVIIRTQPPIVSGEFTPGQSPASLLQTPMLIISDNLKVALNE